MFSISRQFRNSTKWRRLLDHSRCACSTVSAARVSSEHPFNQAKPPWTNGQVERVNRTLKEATVRRYHYETHRQLREHLDAFLNAYNFAKRLKTLRGLTPYEHICKVWADQPERFRYDPTHLTSGLNT